MRREVIENATLYASDCVAAMRSLPAESVDAIVTDPPYELGFMGRAWDASGIAYSVEMWRECVRVLKPGGHLLAFGGSRTFHRMASAIEDAGFDIRDQIMWLYGSGFPKSLDVSKAIDKAAGVERDVLSEGKAVKRMIPGADQVASASWIKDNGREYVPTITAPATDAAREWQGWGTALKPAHEPICVARKPLIGTVAENVLAHGTGALNIDACRVATDDKLNGGATVGATGAHEGWRRPWMNDAEKLAEYADRARSKVEKAETLGRWPANVIHDGSPEVVAAFAAYGEKNGGHHPAARGVGGVSTNGHGGQTALTERFSDAGTAARFFYTAKASTSDRDDGNEHPTVKPTALMTYLVRLVTAAGGVVLDPFTGSGSTGVATVKQNRRFIGIELDPTYFDIACRRIDNAQRQGSLFDALLATENEQ